MSDIFQTYFAFILASLGYPVDDVRWSLGYWGSTPEPQKIPSFHIVNINRLIPAEECWSDVR
ncbi:TPA: hypothetical protein QDC44_000582 [Burkholderia cepacia ATCC 25416]|nr:hypothetical protein [Burkholderia cepacia ATCC 25416]HDR9789526.1 hypothetical protein [Burkholderia cepacia ATCC 25416]